MAPADRSDSDRDRDPGPPATDEDPPPFFARWSSLYLVVLGALFATLTLLVLLTRLYDKP